MRQAQIAFTPGPYPDLDESPYQHLPPRDAVVLLACAKARAALPRLDEGDWRVLAADTLVALEDPNGVARALGQPTDAADARRMLRSLSGRAHQVHSGVALAVRDAAARWWLQSAEATTTIRFRDLTAGEIDAYVATGEPLDKAGAYALQGGAAAFVAARDGEQDTVIGLPVSLVRDLLAWSDAVCDGPGRTGRPPNR